MSSRSPKKLWELEVASFDALAAVEDTEDHYFFWLNSEGDGHAAAKPYGSQVRQDIVTFCSSMRERAELQAMTDDGLSER